MANLIQRAWAFITGCIRRELDEEIERVIERHEEHHAIAHPIPPQFPPQSSPIIIERWREHPRLKTLNRRHAVSDLKDLNEISHYINPRLGL